MPPPAARPATARDYAAITAHLNLPPTATRDARMQAVVDALWHAFGHDKKGPGRAISWIGFYLKVPGKDEMVLGPRRDKPACSPIALHGACGRAFLSRRRLIVTDVANLGPGYIACDPRDKSEVVVPCLEPDGSCWGVLDGDSYEVRAFVQNDTGELSHVLARAGLSLAPADMPAVEVV
jgi:putative methionine-R-sulfoxide reductase with GAF domain